MKHTRKIWRISPSFVVIALGHAMPAAADSFKVAEYSNCGIKLGTSIAQLRAAEPKAIWTRRYDLAMKREMPTAILGRDRNDWPTDQKRMMMIFFAGETAEAAAYRISCQKYLVEHEANQGLDEIRAIVRKLGPPIEAFDGDQPISFSLPPRIRIGFPIEYYWGGTRAELRADARKPILFVRLWQDEIDRGLFDFQFHMIDDRLRQ